MNDATEMDEEVYWVVHLDFVSSSESLEEMEEKLGQRRTGRVHRVGNVIGSPRNPKGFRTDNCLSFEYPCDDWPEACRCLSEQVVPLIDRFRTVGLRAQGEVDILYVGPNTYVSGSLPQPLVEACASAGVALTWSLTVVWPAQGRRRDCGPPA